VSVFNPNLARPNPPDSPGLVSQEEDIACHALHGEIFIDFSHEGPRGLLDYVIVSHVRYCAATGDGSQAGPATGSQSAPDAITVDHGGAPPPPGGYSFGKHLEDTFKFLAGEVTIRVSPTTQSPHLFLCKLSAG
jgi:hypothetical protein